MVQIFIFPRADIPIFHLNATYFTSQWWIRITAFLHRSGSFLRFARCVVVCNKQNGIEAKWYRIS